jgi:Glycosyl hydrolase family 26
VTRHLSRVLAALLTGLGGLVMTPLPALAAPFSGVGTVYAGMYSTEWESETDLSNMAVWAGKRATFVGTFHEPGEWVGAAAHLLEEAWDAQATPFANLSINATAASIAAGNHDAAIRQWAQRVEAWVDDGGGRSLILAPLQEMNGDWVPYGCNPTAFKNAYVRIRNIVRGEGLDETRVRWAWAPNGWTSTGCGSLADYYPGADVVDVIGYSAYRWGGETVQAVAGGVAATLRTFAPDKPYLLAQTAAGVSPSRDQWIRDLFSWAASDPNMIGLIWFNFQKEQDWRVWNSPSGPGLANGWRDALQQATTKHQWPLTDWFQPGPLPFDPNPPVADQCPNGQECDVVAFQDAGGKFHLWDKIASPHGTTSFFYGNPGDVAFSGDWDCDGVDTPGLYRQSDGFAYLRNSNSQGTADITFIFGNPGDFPLAGDFDHDGCDTVAIYRPSESRVYIINELGQNGGSLGNAEYAYYFGNPGDKAFTGDFNGDGTDTVGLHRASSGFVYFRNTNTTGVADNQFFYGNPGDKLAAGDWNGDGIDTVAVYRPSSGFLYIRNSNTQGNADATIFAGSYNGLVVIRR